MQNDIHFDIVNAGSIFHNEQKNIKFKSNRRRSSDIVKIKQSMV